MFSLGNKTLTELVGVHPILAFAVYMAIQRTKQDFAICDKGGRRTDPEQAWMYAQGRTREGRKVTWTLDSFHQYGLAVDLVAWVNGTYSWDIKYYKAIIKAMKEVIAEYKLPIDHGYDLWGKDLPHWQISKLEGRDAREVYDIRKYNL